MSNEKVYEIDGFLMGPTTPAKAPSTNPVTRADIEEIVKLDNPELFQRNSYFHYAVVTSLQQSNDYNAVRSLLIHLADLSRELQRRLDDAIADAETRPSRPLLAPSPGPK